MFVPEDGLKGGIMEQGDRAIAQRLWRLQRSSMVADGRRIMFLHNPYNQGTTPSSVQPQLVVLMPQAGLLMPNSFPELQNNP